MTVAPARRVPWGAAATLSGEAVARLTLVVFQFLVANGLGPERYGTFGLVLSYAAALLPLADLGLQGLILRHLANNPDPRGLPALLGLKLAATLLYAASVAVLAALSPAGDGLAAATLLAGLYWALSSLGDFLRQALRARERSVAEFRARLVQPLALLPALALFHVLRPGVTGALLLWGLPAAALVGAYLAPIRRLFPSLRPRAGETAAVLAGRGRFLAHSAAYLLVGTLSGRVELWLIDWGPGRAAVGYYFAAYSLVFSGIFFGQALSAHMYPRLHRGADPARDLLRACAAHAGLALGLFAAVALLGEPVYRLVFRAEGFAAGAELLPRLGLLLAVATLNWLWLAVLIGLDRQWVATLGLAAILAGKTWLALRWIPERGAAGMVDASLWIEIPVTVAVGFAACGMHLRRRRESGRGLNL